MNKNNKLECQESKIVLTIDLKKNLDFKNNNFYKINIIILCVKA